MRRLKIILLAVVLPLAVIGGCGALVAKKFRPKLDPPRTAKVARGDVVVAVRETGAVEPIKRVEVKSKVTGMLTSLTVEEGDHVTQGQVIATLDVPELRAQRDQIKAQLDGAKARLQQARLTYARDQELAGQQVKQAEANLRAAQAAVKQAEAQRQEAARNAASKKRLFDMGGYVSRNDVQTAASAEEVATQAVQSANEGVHQQELAVGMARTRRAEVALSLSRVGESDASLRQIGDALAEIESKLKDATIVAPCSGVIISRQVRAGELMTAVSYYGSGAPIVVIGDLSTMLVKVDLNEVDIDKVHLGQTVSITADALAGRRFQGRVTRIAPASSSSTTQSNSGQTIVRFPIEITVISPSRELKPGMTANVEIICQRARDVLWAPNDSLFQKHGKWYVSVITGEKDGKPTKQEREVRKGLANDARTEMRSGVKLGEKVELGKSGIVARKKIDINRNDGGGN